VHVLKGVIGPGFNDRFGDVFGNVYAFTSDGLSQRQLRDRVEDVTVALWRLPLGARKRETSAPNLLVRPYQGPNSKSMAVKPTFTSWKHSGP
jgi:hypothetical protein